MGSFAETITLEELYSDPYPIYSRLRRDEPVAWVPALNTWLVTRWHDVRRVMASPEAFVTSDPDGPLTKLCGPGRTMLSLEGDAHAELREGIDGGLAREATPDFEAIANEVATAELATLSGRSEIELMSEYFHPVCVRAMARILGLGALSSATLHGWATAYTGALQNPTGDPSRNTAAAAASRDIDAELGPILAELAVHPDGSVLSALVGAGAAVHAGYRVDAVLPTVKQMISGLEEPGWLAGSLVHALAGHPEQLAAVRADRGLLTAAVHETMRWLPPLGTIGRKTTADVVFGTVRLPAGTAIAAGLAAANRDEAEFDEAERFDIFRTRKPYASLGYGRHRCLVAEVIPILAEVAVDRLLRGYPDLRFEPDTRQLRGWKFRGPHELHAYPVTRAVAAR